MGLLFLHFFFFFPLGQANWLEGGAEAVSVAGALWLGWGVGTIGCQ